MVAVIFQFTPSAVGEAVTHNRTSSNSIQHHRVTHSCKESYDNAVFYPTNEKKYLRNLVLTGLFVNWEELTRMMSKLISNSVDKSWIS